MKNIFYKYNCSGNTFVVVKYDSTIDYKYFSKKICGETEGVKADGLLVVKDDINEVIYYNQDGTKANFCGNGLRATLHYLRNQKGLYKRTIPVLFNNEIYYCKVLSDDPFCSEIMINKDKHINLKIPSKFNNYVEKTTIPNVITYKNHKFKMYPLKVGVFHLIIINDTKLTNNQFLSEQDIINLKEMLKSYYNEEPNIEIIKLDEEEKTIAEVTFYERGVGYTKTCGSGSVAIGCVLELMNFVMDQYIKITDDLFVIIKESTISLIGKSNLVCMGKYLW